MNLSTTCLRYMKLTSLSRSRFTLVVWAVRESWAPLGTEGDWAVSDTMVDEPEYAGAEDWTAKTAADGLVDEDGWKDWEEGELEFPWP